ncbi:MAG: hypothetical protein K2G28_07140, partial [Acetatifactor sp.]|nr:hypothetical protein [Acetatifactor sp.]
MVKRIWRTAAFETGLPLLLRAAENPYCCKNDNDLGWRIWYNDLIQGRKRPEFKKGSFAYNRKELRQIMKRVI